MTLPHDDNVYAVASQGHTILEQGLYEQSATQKYDLGHILRLNDGRTFVYAKAGGTLTAGQLLQSKANAHIEAKASNFNLASGKALAVGDTTVYFTGTAALSSVVEGAATTVISANRFSGGYMYISTTTATGEGSTYKIKSNPAASSTTGTVTLNLYDPIRVACTTTAGASSIGVAMSPYLDVITHPTTSTGLAIGLAPIAVTDDYYFWMQTYGPASALFHGAGTGDAPTAGNTIAASTTTAGAVALATATTQMTRAVGNVFGTMVSGANESYVPVFLKIQA